MFKVFNMGTRMEIYLEDTSFAKEIIEIVASFGLNAQIIGRVEASEKALVTMNYQGKTWQYSGQ
jgi:phosphoribosylformylglycinamidine cyclo-ligase